LNDQEFEVENERSLIPQWQACNDYDVRAELPDCRTPIHVIAFEQDVQAPPAWGKEVAELAANSTYQVVPDAGHASCLGHKHEEINARILELISSDGKRR
jgi:pimeloyl-ACP methyl ester carboxylesterase